MAATLPVPGKPKKRRLSRRRGRADCPQSAADNYHALNLNDLMCRNKYYVTID